MKFKLNEIRLATEGISELSAFAEKNGKEIPSKIAYWLARDLDKLNSENTPIEKVRMDLIKKYAKKDKKGNPMFMKEKDENGKDTEKDTNQFDISDINAFQDEFIKLTNEEVEIDIKPIKLTDLGDVKPTIIMLYKLGKIIEE